ncbi:Tyrosinase P like protein [Verticillium longisporum]|nr:Tyrosinase P like protein [Verticillium longisporum]
MISSLSCGLALGRADGVGADGRLTGVRTNANAFGILALHQGSGESRGEVPSWGFALRHHLSVDSSAVPGARTRYDDFVAIHINQTLSIHGTGNIVTWHRYFLHSYETALRDECGYEGYQPYWKWFKYRDNPTENTLVDGSEYSIGGDGEFWEHNGSTAGMGSVKIPPGNGGGCVTNGPLANMTINIGPVRPGMSGVKANPEGQFAYNPGCLRRDLSSYTLIKWMTATDLINITLGDASHTILSFQTELQGRFSDGFLGMHAAGYAAVGGEANDPFSSPNDPSFFLHHAMVDCLYWILQVLHTLQADQVAGTITILDNPPSRNAVKEDTISMGVLAKDVTIGHLINTLIGRPLCYVYV